MQLLQEINKEGFSTVPTSPRVFCKIFEDNSGTLKIARTSKLQPRTKHINHVYHHFRELVRNGTTQVFSIESVNQIADIFTKPLP